MPMIRNEQMKEVRIKSRKERIGEGKFATAAADKELDPFELLGRKFYKKYRKESFGALTLKEHFQRHAELSLQQISNKVK